MIQVPDIFARWLWGNDYRKELNLLYFGHVEILTDDIMEKWFASEEYKEYLKQRDEEAKEQ